MKKKEEVKVKLTAGELLHKLDRLQRIDEILSGNSALYKERDALVQDILTAFITVDGNKIIIQTKKVIGKEKKVTCLPSFLPEVGTFKSKGFKTAAFEFFGIESKPIVRKNNV